MGMLVVWRSCLRARRGPTPQHLVQRVWVGVGEHPAQLVR